MQIEDAYLCGELFSGKPGRVYENKVPSVAAVSLMDQGRPRFVELTPVPGFTSQAISTRVRPNLVVGTNVSSDGL